MLNSLRRRRGKVAVLPLTVDVGNAIIKYRIQIPDRESHLHGVLEPLSRSKEPPFCIMDVAHLIV